MTIHNDNNIKAVAEFAQAYSERLQSMYNGLKGIDVFCVDIDWDNIPQEFSKFEKKDLVMDEIFCDNIAHSLDLSDHIIAALDTMSKAGYDNVQEIADRKAIAETVKVCKDNLPQTDPMSPLNSFFNVAIPDLEN